MSSMNGSTRPDAGSGIQRKAYWRSLDELSRSPEFATYLEREFPAAAPSVITDATRRSFVKLMGASAALAGLVGCRWPKENILPYSHRPEGRTPGSPIMFASTFELGGAGIGVLVKSYDGRPIKVEGNPAHPGSLGGSNVHAQASVLELYDPDRSQYVAKRDGGSRRASNLHAFDEFFRAHLEGHRRARGNGLAVLSHETSSPTAARLRADFAARYPNARWVTYEPLSRENETAGSALAFGSPMRSRLHLDRADVVVAFDADVLGRHPNNVRHQRDWASRRRAVDGEMNRVYAIEADLTRTGSVADHRVALRPAAIAGFARQLARRLVDAGVRNAALDEAAGGWSAGSDDPVLAAIVDDLTHARGRSILVAGPGQPPEVHALCHAINVALGNVGHTITYAIEPEGGASITALAALVDEMRGGSVSTLVILGGNPVYDAPVDLGFADALGRVETVVHLGLHEDESADASSWHVPLAHYLESWGDARAWDGSVSIVQPLIASLYGGRTVIEMIAFMNGDEVPDGYALVRETHASLVATPEEIGWRRALHDGIVPSSAAPAERPSLDSRLGGRLAGFTPRSEGEMDVVFRQDASIYDGRFANVGWLQEVPDPLTTLAWDNAALMGLADAERLGLSTHDRVTLSHGGRSVTLPVYVMPGIAAGVVSVALGYGRAKAGRVGTGTGVDVYALRSSAAPWTATGAGIARADGSYRLCVTQDHFAIDQVGMEGREERMHELYREADLDHYKSHPDFAKHAIHHPPLESLFEEWTYEGSKWGMSIDLTACTGCRTCTVACQAENNIPIVGREEVQKGREMHWIRVDRYFVGEAESPQVAHQPVTCHHCQNAPCEQVCPVAATVHDDEGLNVMVYNRCIGTRYCLNNCPYKVRRFNFHNNMKYLTETDKMGKNPEVTVRSRGVMEKCSFCVQRIKAVTQAAKNENRAFVDGEILTACQQACPTEAIVFGDLSDPESRVSKAQAHNRSYAMLAELNVKPRLHYMAKLRNPAGSLATPHDGGGAAHGAGSHAAGQDTHSEEASH